MIDEPAIEQDEAPPNGGPPADAGWTPDKNGKPYVRRQSGRGVLYRQGEETVEQALARDAMAAQDRDERPSRARKGKTTKKPAPPGKADLKELEPVLSEALSAPAMICGAFGDVWAADHFTNQGPILARNLVASAEHNPWLRKKLEKAASGEEMTMQLLSMVGVVGALFGYAVPPIIYWFNMPVPDEARRLFNVPPRREHAPSPPRAQPQAA